MSLFPRDMRFGQWFGEDQFESYRALGYRIACTALQTAVEQSQTRDKPDIDQLCENLHGPGSSDTDSTAKSGTH